MTHAEKWKRIEDIDAELARLDADGKRLAKEKSDLLMTRATDETRFLTPRFLCPHCVAKGNRNQRLAVTFAPHFGPDAWLTPGSAYHAARREGVDACSRRDL
jgi:hypothetical protein